MALFGSNNNGNAAGLAAERLDALGRSKETPDEGAPTSPVAAPEAPTPSTKVEAATVEPVTPAPLKVLEPGATSTPRPAPEPAASRATSTDEPSEAFRAALRHARAEEARYAERLDALAREIETLTARRDEAATLARSLEAFLRRE